MISTKLTAFQFRAARTALRLSLNELSKMSCISRATLLRIEKTDNLDCPLCHLSTLKTLQNFYESRGIEFLGTQAIYLMNELEKKEFNKNTLAP